MGCNVAQCADGLSISLIPFLPPSPKRSSFSSPNRAQSRDRLLESISRVAITVNQPLYLRRFALTRISSPLSHLFITHVAQVSKQEKHVYAATIFDLNTKYGASKHYDRIFTRGREIFFRIDPVLFYSQLTLRLYDDRPFRGVARIHYNIEFPT